MNENVDWTEFNYDLKEILERNDIGKYFDHNLYEITDFLTSCLRHAIAILPQDMQKTN